MPKLNNTFFYKKAIFILCIYFILMTLFWLFLTYFSLKNIIDNYFFGLFLAFMPFIGFLFGVHVSKHWGFITSKLGRAIFFISLGQMFWSVGTIIFAYYNIVLQQEVPYPSLADLSYSLLYVFYVLGAYNLAHATGARSSSHSKTIKFIIPIIPILVFLLVYLLNLRPYLNTIESFSIEVLLDIVYPLLDSILLSFTLITLILSYRYLGGKYRIAVYVLLLGFVIEFIADFSFSITTSKELFYVGNWVDYLFLLSNFIVGIAVILMSPDRILNVTTKTDRENG